MGLLDLLLHLTGFALPALLVAPLLALMAMVFEPFRLAVRAVCAQAAINVIVGVVVLMAGLSIFGRDGRMATYAALVAAMASSQWLMNRAWR